ncbi:hypothetical protein [Phaeobacter inhibens]|nr:hypothetical protein [Phaeobacter inhibens]AUQ65766.1 hypothetical protein PhaeoP78_00885 [Phaeobacter inhibens]
MTNDAPQVDAEILKKIAAVRNQVRENFGRIAKAMMALLRSVIAPWPI